MLVWVGTWSITSFHCFGQFNRTSLSLFSSRGMMPALNISASVIIFLNIIYENIFKTTKNSSNMKSYYTSEQPHKIDDSLPFPHQKGYGRGSKTTTYIEVLIIWDYVPPKTILCPLDKWKIGRDRIHKLSSYGQLFCLIKPYNCVQSGQGTEGMTFYFLCDKVNLAPLLSRNNYVSMIGTDSSEAERLLPFRSPFQFLSTALLFSSFFPNRGMWRQERGAPGGMKRKNHFSSLYLPQQAVLLS